MIRVARRASCDGGATRTGLGFCFEDGKRERWRDVVVLPSAMRPVRMWIAAASVYVQVEG